MTEEPTKSEEKPNRDEEGKFLPGHAVAGPGRPKGSYSIMTIIRKKMEEIPLGQTKAWKEQIADIIVEEAVVKRNANMLNLIVDHMDGKPKQPIEIDVDRENVSNLSGVLKQISELKPTSNGTPTESGGQAG
jgi:hypothetical protein